MDSRLRERRGVDIPSIYSLSAALPSRRLIARSGKRPTPPPVARSHEGGYGRGRRDACAKETPWSNPN